MGGMIGINEMFNQQQASPYWHQMLGGLGSTTVTGSMAGMANASYLFRVLSCNAKQPLCGYRFHCFCDREQGVRQ
jgi:hypothetical protein